MSQLFSGQVLVSLTGCCKRGAGRFGWSKRNQQPRSMRSGGVLAGFGIYQVEHSPAAALAKLTAAGKLTIRRVTVDTGSGTPINCCNPTATD